MGKLIVKKAGNRPRRWLGWRTGGPSRRSWPPTFGGRLLLYEIAQRLTVELSEGLQFDHIQAMLAGFAARDIGLLLPELLGDIGLPQARRDASLPQSGDDVPVPLGVDGLLHGQPAS